MTACKIIGCNSEYYVWRYSTNCLWQVSDQNRSCPFITLQYSQNHIFIKSLLFPIFFFGVLVGKLFYSFFNPLISWYIYYDQLSMNKYGEKNKIMFSRGSFPGKLNWKRHIYGKFDHFSTRRCQQLKTH